MTFVRYFFLSTVVATALCGQVSATTIYNDGGVHNLTTPQGDVAVSSGTTVNFLSGSSATGVNDSGGAAVNVSGSSHAAVFGGSITGGTKTTGSGFGGMGIYATGGTLDIYGGSIVGGLNTGSGFGGNGVYAGNTAVSISDGTISGGNVSVSGFGGNGVNVSSGTFAISGGTITGGGSPNVGGNALYFYTTAGTLSGGTFSTSANGYGLYARDSSVALTGGLFDIGGIWNVIGSTVIDVYGTDLVLTGGPTSGTLSGILQNGDAIDIAYIGDGNGQILLHDPIPVAVAVSEPPMVAMLGLFTVVLETERRRRRLALTA